MKVSEQNILAVLFIMLYKVVLTFESVDKLIEYEYSNESYSAVLSCGAVYYAVHDGSNFWVCGWNSKVWPFKWKLLSSTFLLCCLLCCTRWLKRLSLWIKLLSVTIQTSKRYLISFTGTVFLFFFLCFTCTSNFWVCGWNPKVTDHSNDSY